MDIFISDTGSTQTLKLFNMGDDKNIAKKFIKDSARKIFGGGKMKAEDALYEFGCGRMTESKFNEWTAIMKTKQDALLACNDYLAVRDNELHGLVKSELKESKHYQLGDCGYDKMFALKNAVDAELQIFKRLAYGTITVKEPIDRTVHPKDGNTSSTLNIKHWRHTIDNVGEEFLMQVFCDFIMLMPDAKDSFEFTAGVELEFHKVHGGDLEHIDDEKWIFPFSMSFDQEQHVLGILHGGAQREFIRLGIDGGIPLETLSGE